MDTPDRVQATYQPRFGPDHDIGSILRGVVKSIATEEEISGEEAL
jgi:hypothetical protein